MSKLAMYLERVSQEDAELEQEVEIEQTPEEIAVQEVIVENELEVPEVPEEPITEEQIEEAELETEEAVDEEAVIASEIDEIEDATEEVEELQESMEHFVQVLQHGIKTKTYSPQFAATVAFQLDKMKSILGDDIGTPSLENYGGENLEEFYTVSVESFKGFMKRVDDATGRMFQAIPELLANHQLVNGYKKRVNALNTKADALDAAVKEMDGTATYEGKAPKALRGSGSNLVSAVSNEIKLLAQASGKGLDANAKLLDDILSILNKATTEGGVNKTGAIVAEAAKLKPVYDVYPEAAFSEGFLGGLKLVKDDKEIKEADVRGTLKILGKGAIPGIDKVKKEVSEVKLTKADTVKLLAMVKVLAQLADKAANNTGSEAIQRHKNTFGAKQRATASSLVGGANITSWSEGKDLDSLATAAPKIMYKHIRVYRELVGQILKVAEASLQVVKSATKKSKAVSNEEKAK